MSNPQKIPQKYICKICDYNTSNKKDYNKHLLTAKHINRTNRTEKSPKIPKNPQKLIIPKEFECECGKKYKARSGLWNHKKKCDYKPEVEDTMEKIVKEETKEDIDYKLLLLKMMEQNNELQNTIITFYNNYKNL